MLTHALHVTDTSYGATSKLDPGICLETDSRTFRFGGMKMSCSQALNVRIWAMSGALMLMLALGFGCTTDPVPDIDNDPVINIDDDPGRSIDDDPVTNIDDDPVTNTDDDPVANIDDDPVADAGEDQTTTGDSVQLDGSASFDPDGNSLDFLWTQISGTPVALVQADSAIAGFETPDVSDMLVFQLTVDNGQAQSTDSVTVIVEGLPDAETRAERVVTRLESIEDPAARASAAVFTFNYFRTLDRLAGGTVEGRVETALSGYIAGLSLEVRAELQQLGGTLDAIPVATRLNLLGRFGKYDPVSTGAPNWDAISKSVLRSHRLMPRLRAEYCSGNFTYGDGTIADRAITVSSRTLISSSDPEFGGDVVAADASPVVLGVEGEFVSARHPSLQATDTVPPGDGISPYGASTGIPCTSGGSQCDANKGYVCGTVFGFASPASCIAYPVLQKEHDVVLRGYNFWDIDEARLVFTPLFPGDGTEATSIVSFVDAKEPTTGADACPVPTPANPTHNLAHFRVVADEGHFYKLRMYNHNGNFFTQADALDDADARVLHVCYPGSSPNNAPVGTVRDCTLPVGTCPEDGAECAATWGTPPRKFEDCRHLPGEVPICGETPEWFGSETLMRREDDVAVTPLDIIVYVLDEEPRYEFTATLQAVQCLEETGADFLGSDEPMLMLAGFPDALPPGVDADIASKLDESLDAWQGSGYDSGDRKTEIQVLSTVGNLTFENQVLYILVVAEDDGFLGGFLAGAAVIVGAAAIIYLTGGAALWTTALGTAGALAIWGPIMASLGEDDLLGTSTFTAISLNFDERTAASHSPDFLTVPRLFGALPALPDGPSEGELPARLIHPFVDYRVSEEPLAAECNPGACPSGEDCVINRCFEPAFFEDPSLVIGFRERREFELGGGHYAIDILWEMRTTLP